MIGKNLLIGVKTKRMKGTILLIINARIGS